jgi:hypothetical protein
MLTRRWVLTGLIAAPAVIAADRLMPVRTVDWKQLLAVLGVGSVDWKRSVDWKLSSDGTSKLMGEKLDSSWEPAHGYREGDILHMTYYRKDLLWKSSV